MSKALNVGGGRAKNNHIHIQVTIYNLMVTTNQKSIIETQKRERNPNITLKKDIKSQGKRANE